MDDLDEGEFEDISLDDRACDICKQDTGERLRRCKICYNPRPERVTPGYNYVPIVVHKNERAHKRCFIKAHEIIHGNALDPGESRSSGNSPRHQSRRETAPVLTSIADKLIKVIKEKRSSSRERSQSDVGRRDDERLKNKLKIAQFYNLPPPDATPSGYYGYLPASNGTTYYGQTHHQSLSRSKGKKLLHSKETEIYCCAENCREKCCANKSNKWDKIRPKKERKLLVRLSNDDIDVVDVTTYSSPNDDVAKRNGDVTKRSANENMAKPPEQPNSDMPTRILTSDSGMI